jgi:hypothetical protein
MSKTYHRSFVLKILKEALRKALSQGTQGLSLKEHRGSRTIYAFKWGGRRRGEGGEISRDRSIQNNAYTAARQTPHTHHTTHTHTHTHTHTRTHTHTHTQHTHTDDNGGKEADLHEAPEAHRSSFSSLLYVSSCSELLYVSSTPLCVIIRST